MDIRNKADALYALVARGATAGERTAAAKQLTVLVRKGIAAKTLRKCQHRVNVDGQLTGCAFHAQHDGDYHDYVTPTGQLALAPAPLALKAA